MSRLDFFKAAIMTHGRAAFLAAYAFVGFLEQTRDYFIEPATQQKWHIEKIQFPLWIWALGILLIVIWMVVDHSHKELNKKEEKIAALEEAGPHIFLELVSSPYASISREWLISVQNVSACPALKIELKMHDGEWGTHFDVIPFLTGGNKCTASQNANTFNGNLNLGSAIPATIRDFLRASRSGKAAQKVSRIITVVFESQSGTCYERDFELSCEYSLMDVKNGIILARGNRRITRHA
jgi:hypothetical protein